MSILSIDTIHQSENGQIYVTAVIEDVVETYAQTLYDPAEYGPGLCEAAFTLEEDQSLPDDETELLQFIEELDLTWELMDNSDEYIGLTD